jgi:glycosyltransferase involved in cell wall biosynthesis
MPFFSVVIPLYNKEDFIQNTLKSVLNQTFQDFEIIIIDDGSTDKSAEKVKEIDNPKINYCRIENQGVSNARNVGIQHSKADYICFLDADDYWYPHFLEQMYKYIQLLPDQKVFAYAIEFQITNKIIPSVYSIDKNGEYQIVNYFESSLRQSVLCSSSIVVEKSVFDKTGLFNVAYQAGEDTDLWIRIGIYFPVVFIWKIGARYVHDKHSLSLNRKKLVSKANFEEYQDLEQENASLKKFLDYNRFSLAIESKVFKEKDSFQRYCKQLDLDNLPLRKKILLYLPSGILRFLIQVKRNLARLGIGNSVFK